MSNLDFHRLKHLKNFTLFESNIDSFEDSHPNDCDLSIAKILMDKKIVWNGNNIFERDPAVWYAITGSLSFKTFERFFNYNTNISETEYSMLFYDFYIAKTDKKPITRLIRDYIINGKYEKMFKDEVERKPGKKNETKEEISLKYKIPIDISVLVKIMIDMEYPEVIWENIY